MTNFTVKQGTDFRRDFRCKDTAGAVVNLTGYTAYFVATYRDTTIEKTSSDLFDSSTDGDQSEGMIHLHVTVAESREVPIGEQMQWALEVRAPGNSPPGSGDQIILDSGYLIGEQGNDNVD